MALQIFEVLHFDLQRVFVEFDGQYSEGSVCAEENTVSDVEESLHEKFGREGERENGSVLQGHFGDLFEKETDVVSEVSALGKSIEVAALETIFDCAVVGATVSAVTVTVIALRNNVLAIAANFLTELTNQMEPLKAKTALIYRVNVEVLIESARNAAGLRAYADGHHAPHNCGAVLIGKRISFVANTATANGVEPIWVGTFSTAVILKWETIVYFGTGELMSAAEFSGVTQFAFDAGIII